MATREPAVKREIKVETTTSITISNDELKAILAQHFSSKPATKVFGLADVKLDHIYLSDDCSGDSFYGDLVLRWTTTETR